MCSNKEKEVLLTLMDMYKNMPYLWKKDHKDYMNKNVRTEGFRVLLEIYKNIDEKATVKHVKKKIENLRTSYIKELKKVLASKHSGAGDDEVYVPTLWYFNALSFLDNRTENFELERKSSGTLKRKIKKSLLEKQGHVLETADKLVTTLSQRDEQWEIYGRSIGFQMKDLNKNQLVICQKLISDVIFCAKFDKLNVNSHIVNP